MNDKTQFFGEQIKGARDYQEDSFSIQVSGDETLFLLCDGMGGHAGGDQASSLVVQEFHQGFSQDSTAPIRKRLEAGLTSANAAIQQVGSQSRELKGMGTTLVAVYLVGDQIQWVSVGDSPLWLLRENQLQRLNADHSLAAVFKKLVEVGEMTAEDAANEPKRHALRSSVNGGEIKLVDLPDSPFALQDGDSLLLASDGLETLTDQEIIQLVNDGGEPQQIVARLLQAVTTYQKSDQDNATVIFYRHGKMPSEKIAPLPFLKPIVLSLFLVSVFLIAGAWQWFDLPVNDGCSNDMSSVNAQCISSSEQEKVTSSAEKGLAKAEQGRVTQNDQEQVTKVVPEKLANSEQQEVTTTAPKPVTQLDQESLVKVKSEPGDVTKADHGKIAISKDNQNLKGNAKAELEHFGEVMHKSAANTELQELTTLATGKMVVIPSGIFQMGSNNSSSHEKSVHMVAIQTFSMSQTEVTFAQWDACVSAGGCSHKPDDESLGRGNRPVINVSYEDITREFIPWLNNITGMTGDMKYRLPTEAQWEYAANAGSNSRNRWNTDIQCPQVANGNEGDCDNHAQTVPVKSSTANHFGLYNMHTNVWEWTQDCWNDSYSGAPNDGSAWTTGDFSMHVLRGSSDLNGLNFLSSADRIKRVVSARSLSYGFRIVHGL
jgi:formylglycine-generating enzyme required for sulfatase activity/serine/threonine protein phosphatase PrpC